MRLWMKLALVMVLVAIVPMFVTGVGAVNIATEKAEESASLILEREAVAQAEFVGRWTNDQLQALVGWMQPFPLGTMPPEKQTNLLRAIWSAVPSVVVTALVDGDGGLVLPPVYITDPSRLNQLSEREAGTAERAEALVERLPISDIVGSTEKVAVGTPYLPEGGVQVALPVLVSGPFGNDVLLGVDLSLGTQVRHFRRSSSATRGMALVDSSGRAIIGGDHPLIDAKGLRPLLGNRAFFTQTIGDSQVKGAVAPVPYTDWTLVVAEPASLAQLPATEIPVSYTHLTLPTILLV